jgi:integrase
MSTSSPRYSLYKRQNHVYYIGYYHDGRRHWKSTGATTRPEALKALTNFQKLLNKRPRCVILQQFIRDFLAFALSNYSAKTYELYERCLDRFSRLAGSIAVKEVTAEHIDRYKTKRLKELTPEYTGSKTEKKLKPISPVTVNIELRALRAAFKTAKRWKMIDWDPFDGVTFATVPEQAPVFFTVADFQKFINCIGALWFKEVVLFAVLTGMRRGEIVNLRWQDVDLSRRVIFIQSSPTFKTKAGRRRTVPMSDSVLYLLTSKQGKSRSEFVFTLNDEPISDVWVTHLFKKCVRRCKLSNRRLHFHSLRHTFASWLVQKGATLYEVQRLLGHTSSKVTEVYSHLQPEQLHSTVNRIQISMN